MWITRQSPCSIHTIPRRLRKRDLRELVVTRDDRNGKVQSKNGLVVVFEKRDCLVKKDEIIVIVLQMLHVSNERLRRGGSVWRRLELAQNICFREQIGVMRKLRAAAMMALFEPFFFEGTVNFVNLFGCGFPVHVRKVHRGFPTVTQVYAPVYGSVVCDYVIPWSLDVSIHADRVFLCRTARLVPLLYAHGI